MPSSVRREIEAAELSLTPLPSPTAPIDAAHVFVTRRLELETAVSELRPLLASDGFLWVSWPKKSSSTPSEVTEDDVRRVALPTGLVDIKVCAIDETWSGLKLVIRRDRRPA